MFKVILSNSSHSAQWVEILSEKKIKVEVHEVNLVVGTFLVHFSIVLVNPIPTGTGRNQPIYEYHLTTASRNRVKDQKHNSERTHTLEL